MIAGFIFLRLRGILGKRTGFEGKTSAQFDKILKEAVTKQAPQKKNIFDENAQKEFYRMGFGGITTEIDSAPEFFYAEDYHQQYLAKNPMGYCGLKGTGISCVVES